ncbi:MAG: GxxExxY protein [Thiopseudomonas sp.]|nr:GxxExxY protein [Thiopseudomonas sp.]
MDSRELTYKIQGCVFEVFRNLGAGFLEAVYQQALLRELREAGLSAVPEQPINVYYKGEVVGEYRADIIVENKVLLELKAQTALPPTAEPQLLNYLKATEIKIGLLVNFTHPKATIKRLVM